MGKYEFIINILLDKIKEINPDDKGLIKNNSYVEIYLGGISLPLIGYLWQQKGLLSTLNDLNINYEISKDKKQAYFIIELKDDEFLYIRPQTLKQKLVINGLMVYIIYLNLRKLTKEPQ